MPEDPLERRPPKPGSRKWDGQQVWDQNMRPKRKAPALDQSCQVDQVALEAGDGLMHKRQRQLVSCTKSHHSSRWPAYIMASVLVLCPRLS